MSLYYIPTKRYVNDKTALQRGLIENPQNFRLPANLQVYQRPNKRFKTGLESLITLDKREQAKFSKRGYDLVYPQQKQVFTESLDDIKAEDNWWEDFFELPNKMAKAHNITTGVIELSFINGNRVINQQFLNLDALDQSELSWWNLKGFHMYNWSSTMKTGIYAGGTEERRLKTDQTKQFIERSTDFRITRYTNIQAYNRTQTFRDGDTHCILHPVQLYYENLIAEAKSEKTKDNRRSLLNKVIFFLKKYNKGIPETEMEAVAKALEVCFIIQDVTFNELKRYNPKAKGHRFTYVNSRINHCDIITIDMHSEPEPIDEEEAVALLESYKTQNIHHTFTGTISKPKTIRSSERWVRVGDDNSDILHNFFNLFDKGMQIDTIKEKELTNFLLEACHMTVNWSNKKAIGEPVRELDIIKAYTQFKHCPHYLGFPGIINNVRETDPKHDTKLYPGVYEIFIDKLEALTAYEEIMTRDYKAYDLLKAYGFKSNHTYILTSAWIEQLKALKVKYTVLRGAWGNRFDFEFTPDMIESKLYAVWTGLNMCKEDQHYYKTYATPEFAQVIQAQQPTSTMTYDKYTETLMIQKPKDVNKIMPHIASFIISYTQLNVFQEAMKYDIAEIYAHKLDSIVLTTTQVKPITNSAIWTVEEGEIKLSKYPCPHIINKSSNAYSFSNMAPVLGNQFISGAGGSGKTHTVLSDAGFRKVLFSSTAWKLITEKALEYKIKGSSINGLVGMGYDNKAIPTVKERFGSPGVIVVDELSMIDGNNIEKIKQLYPLSQLILMGDYEDGRYYQSSIAMENRTVYHPPTYTLISADYRSLDDATKEMKATVRHMMKTKQSMKTINDYLRSIIPKITLNELKESYNLDYVLTGTHSRVDVFTDLLKGEHNHYLVLKHGFEDVGKRLASVPNTYLSGEILNIPLQGRTKLVHAFTVHSFQGSTIPIDKKCFVDLSTLKAVEDIYTAISRVRSIKQLYIIN